MHHQSKQNILNYMEFKKIIDILNQIFLNIFIKIKCLTIFKHTKNIGIVPLTVKQILKFMFFLCNF